VRTGGSGLDGSLRSKWTPVDGPRQVPLPARGRPAATVNPSSQVADVTAQAVGRAKGSGG
jgi:hypothetical protein